MLRAARWSPWSRFRLGCGFGCTLALALTSCTTRAVRRGGADAMAAGAMAADGLEAPASGLREQTADQQLWHVLHRLAFGPRPGDVEAVQAMGVDAWIARQLTPESIPDTLTDQWLARFATLGESGDLLLRRYPPAGVVQAQLARERGGTLTPADSQTLQLRNRQANAALNEIATSRVLRAVHSERQLQEVMVDFWENHFTVFNGKDRTRYFIPEYDAVTIRPYALGKFRELLGAVAKSPAMLTYLDNWQSVADSGRTTLAQVTAAQRRVVARRAATVARQLPALAPAVAAAAQRRRGLNENYARELMELHTLGVDGGYTQQDVTDVARILTGWTLSQGVNGGTFLFRPQTHDADPKRVLGQAFPGGRGQEEGEALLDLLARHPATARFLATKLVRRFVSDSPPPALVARAAATYRRTDGDIRAVVRTIVTSPEFFAAAAFRAKVKSPFELVISTMRVLGAAPDSSARTAQLVARLGQPLFGHQAPNGWPETSEPWMNTGAILNRINFGLNVATGRVPVVRLTSWPSARPLATLPREAQVDGVIHALFGGAVSRDTRDVLITGTNPFLQARAGQTVGVMADDAMTDSAPPVAPTPPSRAAAFAQIVGLALGAPEFQRR